MPETAFSDNTKKALTYLKTLFHDKRINIVAIDPHNDNVTAITRPVGSDAIANFIEQYNGHRNIYYSVNTPTDDAPDNKLKKHHIKEINAVWLDADPAKDKDFAAERKRLLQFAKDLAMGDNPPTVITDSGGGIQAFWFLDKPVPATEDSRAEYEALSRGLADQYDTDRVQNIDRIMRVPYTWNIPGPKKKGREKSLAKCTKINPNRIADLSFITPSEAADTSETTLDYNQITLADVKKPFDGEILAKFNEALSRNDKIDDLWTLKNDFKDGDRSDRDFTLTKELKSEGFTLHEVAVILWNYPHGKVPSVKYPVREIVRCYERSGIDFVGTVDDETIERIAKQVNPILAARAAGKPLEEDLKRSARFRSVKLSDMDWKKSGKPIYRDFIYERAITVIYGKSNTGKSFLATDIAGHIALGRSWNNMEFEPEKTPAVLYICAEAGHSFAIRGKALMTRLQVNELPFFVITEAPSFARENKADAKEIIQEIQRIEKENGVKIGIVVVDTLAVTFQGDENSSKDMGVFVDNMKYIQNTANTGIVIVHHSGKDQTAGARGSSALQGATDAELEVKSEKRGERYFRQVEVKKMRDGKMGMIVKFGLNIVDLGKDDRGKPIDTCCIVLETDNDFMDVTPSLFENLTSNQKLALEAIYLFDKMNVNPDTLLQGGKKFTEKEVKSLILKDLKERNPTNRILVTKQGIDLEQLAFCAKPVLRGITKALEDARTQTERENIHVITEEFQLVDKAMEQMEREKNNSKSSTEQ